MSIPNPYRQTYVTDKASREYTDIDISLRRHPISKDILVKNGVDAVKQSVVNLVMLNLHDKPFHSNIGGDIYPMMFENFELPGTEELLRSKIRKTLQEYEPRIEIQKILIDVRPDKNDVVASIYFKLLSTLEPVSVDLFLEMVR